MSVPVAPLHAHCGNEVTGAVEVAVVVVCECACTGEIPGVVFALERDSPPLIHALQLGIVFLSSSARARTRACVCGHHHTG